MKKYVITGSLGNISKPIVEGLLANGNKVSVITSNADREKEIQALGATPLKGDVFDSAFLENAFAGADAVYTMIPPIWKTDDWRASQNAVGENYIKAIKKNRITHVVNLSSVGAHLGNNCGPVDGLYDFEQMLNVVPGLHVKHLRPAYFYHNLLGQIPMIKNNGIMGGNYGGTDKLLLVHPRDIAQVALEELLSLSFTGSSHRYIIGDERPGKEIAEVLGKAVGREIPWVVFSDEDQQNGMLQAGLPPAIATQYAIMGHALSDGSMQGDVRAHKPEYTSTKLEDFSKEFAGAFHSEVKAHA